MKACYSIIALFTATLTLAETANAVTPPPGQENGDSRRVRTTAYSHGEAAHLVYGRKNAIGKPLRYGKIRSAAAD